MRTLLLILCLLLTLIVPASADSFFEIHFLDVGQADAAIVLCDGEVLMIDGGEPGDSQLVFSYLTNTLSVTHIDTMIATHPHEDHIGGLAAALNACSVGTIYSPVTDYDSRAFSSLLKYADQQGVPLTVPATGDTFTVGSAEVTFLADGQGSSDVNNQSLVCRIVYGEMSFLFMGDAETPIEEQLMSSGAELRSTLLKVGHHGSDSSSSEMFLRAVQPQYAVISVGKGNKYGHPHDETISRLTDIGAALLRTDKLGHVVCVSNGRELSFSVERGAVAAQPSDTVWAW